jgi:hypothetical protein
MPTWITRSWTRPGVFSGRVEPTAAITVPTTRTATAIHFAKKNHNEKTPRTTAGRMRTAKIVALLWPFLVEDSLALDHKDDEPNQQEEGNRNDEGAENDEDPEGQPSRDDRLLPDNPIVYATGAKCVRRW